MAIRCLWNTWLVNIIAIIFRYDIKLAITYYAVLYLHEWWEGYITYLNHAYDISPGVALPQ